MRTKMVNLTMRIIYNSGNEEDEEDDDGNLDLDNFEEKKGLVKMVVKLR